MITMLGLFIVVTYVEQRLIVLPNTAGKKELYGSNPCFYFSLASSVKTLWLIIIIKKKMKLHQALSTYTTSLSWAKIKFVHE